MLGYPEGNTGHQFPMHTASLFFFGLIAFFWMFYGVRSALGAAQLPRLKYFPPAPDAACPRISVLLAARDEEEKLPPALATLVKLDYPQLEIVAVDDRSKDATGQILDQFAAAHPQLKVVHVNELPPGWLGKPHALQRAYENSSGEWLVFTDADVCFQPDVLRRAVTMAERQKLDHLTLLSAVDMEGFWETVFITFFGMLFQLANAPHAVSDSKSGAYVGIGAFQLLRRTAYEKSGTHRRLAMEVVDDMKLSKIVKQGGFRSGVGIPDEAVRLRWHAGLGNLIRGTTKNFFAGFGYNLAFAIFACTMMFSVHVLPVLGLLFGHGWVRILSGVAVLIALCFHAGVDVALRVSPLYALTYPLGAGLFCYTVARSTCVTLWQGGVTWRDTFYPLADLKRGVV